MLASSLSVVQPADMQALFTTLQAEQPNLDLIVKIINKYYNPMLEGGRIKCLDEVDEDGYTPLGRASARYYKTKHKTFAFIMTLFGLCGQLRFHQDLELKTMGEEVSLMMEDYLRNMIHQEIYEESKDIFSSKAKLSVDNAKLIDRIIFEKYLLLSIRNPDFGLMLNISKTNLDIQQSIYQIYITQHNITTMLAKRGVSRSDHAAVMESVINENRITSNKLLEWYLIVEYLRLKKQTLKINDIYAHNYFECYYDSSEKLRQGQIAVQINYGQAIPKQMKKLFESEKVQRIIAISKNFNTSDKRFYLTCSETPFSFDEFFVRMSVGVASQFNQLVSIKDWNSVTMESGRNALAELNRQYYRLSEQDKASSYGLSLRVAISMLYMADKSLIIKHTPLDPIDISIKEAYAVDHTPEKIADACCFIDELKEYIKARNENLFYYPLISIINPEIAENILKVLLAQIEDFFSRSPFTQKIEKAFPGKKSKGKIFLLGRDEVSHFAAWYRVSVCLGDHPRNEHHDKKLYELFNVLFDQYRETERVSISRAINSLFPADHTWISSLRVSPSIRKVCCYEEDLMAAEKSLQALLLEEETLSKSAPQKKKKKKKTAIVKLKTEEDKENQPDTFVVAETPVENQENVATNIPSDLASSLDDRNDSVSESAVTKPCLPCVSHDLLLDMIGKIASSPAESSQQVRGRILQFITFYTALNLQFSSNTDLAIYLLKFAQRIRASSFANHFLMMQSSVEQYYRLDEKEIFLSTPVWYWNQAIKAMMQEIKIRSNNSESSKEIAGIYNHLLTTIAVDKTKVDFIDSLLEPLTNYLCAQHAPVRVYLGGGQAQQLLLSALDIRLQATAPNSDYDVSVVIALPDARSLHDVCNPAILYQLLSHAHIKSFRDFRMRQEVKCEYSVETNYLGKEVDISVYVDSGLVLRTKRVDSFKSAILDLTSQEVNIMRDHLGYTLENKRYFNPEVFTTASLMAYFLREIGRNAELTKRLPLCEDSRAVFNLTVSSDESTKQQLYLNAIALCLTKYVTTHECDLFSFLLEHHLESLLPQLGIMKSNLLVQLNSLSRQLNSLPATGKNYFVFVLLLCYQYLSLRKNVPYQLKLENFPSAVLSDLEVYQCKLSHEPNYLQGPGAWSMARLFCPPTAVPPLWQQRGNVIPTRTWWQP